MACLQRVQIPFVLLIVASGIDLDQTPMTAIIDVLCGHPCEVRGKGFARRLIYINAFHRCLCQFVTSGGGKADMGLLKRQDECAALAELRQRRKTGETKLELPPAVMYQLQIQRLVEPDDNGEFQINVRGLARLRRLQRDGAARKRNWRLGR
jgi:hypothetical protein